jgi:hypothetical protein
LGQELNTHHGPSQCFLLQNPDWGLRVIARLHGEATMKSSYFSSGHDGPLPAKRRFMQSLPLPLA